ncbi:IS630 family transposase [Nannocystaceae bacterium ST9]
MNVHYIVELTDAEREVLQQSLATAQTRPRKLRRVQILLASDKGLSAEQIAEVLGCGTSSVYRVRRRFVEEGLEEALHERHRPGGARKLTPRDEAVLVALACSKPPLGRSRWTMELLAREVVTLVEHESVSRETVRRRLDENDLKPWREKMWCIPEVDAEFVACMEDVLDLYAEEFDPARPVVSFDETPIQLLGETRVPVAVRPGQPRRVDYEYRRMGTANLFVFVDAHRPWRHVRTTSQRTALDFAECMRDLVDVHYPDAERIRVVLDNLSTHRLKNLYEAFPAAEARRIIKRLEFHHTPKHASWLNMVEIEISVLKSQCLSGRIPDQDTLDVQTTAWCERRNQTGDRIQWMFRVEDARRKLGRAYPIPPMAVEHAAA